MFPNYELAHEMFATLLDEASRSPRQRMFRNLHQSHDEPVQRLVIAMQPSSYVPIHRHSRAHQWELFLVLAGQVDLLVFDEQGKLCWRNTLTAGASLTGLELPSGVWHSVVCDAASVFLEVKQGPFDPSQPREIAPFCPDEQHNNSPAFLRWLKTATVGDMSPWPCENLT